MSREITLVRFLAYSTALFCILFFIPSCVIAVRREDFKTCAQSGFCSRQRHAGPGQIRYDALLHKATFHDSNGTVQFPLRSDVDFQERLTGRIDCLVNSTFRFQIFESSPKRMRYVPVDALLEGSVESKTPAAIVEFSDRRILLTSSIYDLSIDASPFSLTISKTGGEPIISLNSEGLLNFEISDAPNEPSHAAALHLTKHETAEPGSDSGQNDSDDKTDDRMSKPSSCAEEFRGHHDSNPYCHRSVGADITFWGSRHLYGIPEHTDGFLLHSTIREEPYRLHNMDVCNYEVHNRMALYGSVPVIISHSENITCGMLWLNAAETWIDVDYADKQTIFQSLTRRLKSLFKHKQHDIASEHQSASSERDAKKEKIEKRRAQTHWMSETGNIDVFFFLGPLPQDVFRQYARITGTTTSPPLFSLGYHQSRWNYFSQSEVIEILNNFERFSIPSDVIWLDIEYTDGKRYFTWNTDKFPDPTAMTNQLAAKGRKLVVIVDPHIKVDSMYSIFTESKQRGFFIKSADGSSDFEGTCWPGQSSYIDFLNPDARQWYFNQYTFEHFPGTTNDTYLWNDMNEPSVFSGPEITINKDTIHHGGWENRDIHNVYGMLLHLTTYDALIHRSNNTLRPFVLSRSFFAGSQRAGAIWTGDNTNDWEHLQMTIPMMLSLSVVGITFAGADVGGFFDSNKQPELFVRWYQAAAFQPFMRTHSHMQSIRREPWSFEDEDRMLIITALTLRYQMLSFWYTLFYENERSNQLPMAPLWAVFPDDSEVFAIETAYMLGTSMLVSPVMKSNQMTMNVYLPGSNELWFDDEFQQWDGGKYATISITRSSIPRFQRGGTILPLKIRKRRSSKAMINDPLTLSVALDANGCASGHVFMDDGESFKYRTDKQFYYRQFNFNTSRMSSRLVEGDPGFQTHEWIERLMVYPIDKPSSVYIEATNGKASKALTFEYIPSRRLLVVRRPGMNANTDWTIVTK